MLILFHILQITKKCLPAILQLHNLEELVLAGCLGIDDEALATLKQGCKSLEVPIITHTIAYIDISDYWI